ncbi:MAG: GNAT family N-acetyltransferase [Acidobacteria bacterium]|nr:MAG: GNAT family N-acetyltransferase [Acidobacteriota bacterium]
MESETGTAARTDYPAFPELLPEPDRSHPRFEVRFARTPADLDRVARLRFAVFNLELGEGLDESWATGRDLDEYDPGCHHLMVEDRRTGALAGTYRLQTSAMAARHRGFYSASEFDLSGFPAALLEDAIELSRACVAREHRNHQVLFLLWRGLARYVRRSGKRFLFGCCSLTSQDPADGARALAHLRRGGHMHPEYLVHPRPGFGCDGPSAAGGERCELPPLFRVYLRYGAKVCSLPAIDRRFKTIDFLVLFDVTRMPSGDFRRFFE